MRTSVFMLTCCWLISNASTFGQKDDAIAQKGYGFLQKHCLQCHSHAKRESGPLNVESMKVLTEKRGDDEPKWAYLTPGKPEESVLWERAGGEDADMPPKRRVKVLPTEAEKEEFKQWILAGAPMPTALPQQRKVVFRSEVETLIAIRNFMISVPVEDQPYIRFFSFTHIANDPRLTERQLAYYRAALSKVVNSMSWEREIYLPKEVPESQGTIYYIDLRHYGWHRNQAWANILKHYPYGVSYVKSNNQSVRQVAMQIQNMLASGPVELQDAIPHIRGDWFIVTATRPPIYHLLLNIPETTQQLDQMLGVNIADAFYQTTAANRVLARSAFAASNVSAQNRMVERIKSRQGRYYWISYDFKPDRGRQDLIRFPLGPPSIAGKQFESYAFDHDGGEIIFQLPNGMQGYMLALADGKRIDVGPTDIVFDKDRRLGGPEIVNGVSCMMCHRNGMFRRGTGIDDEVRNSGVFVGDVQRKIEDVYPPREEMTRYVNQDEEDFVRALDRTITPFLENVYPEKAAELADPKRRLLAVRTFDEPVSAVVSMYHQEMDINSVANELGYQDVNTFRGLIQGNPKMRRLGLGVLLQKVREEEAQPVIKRAKWELRDGTSLYQDAMMAKNEGASAIVGS